MTRTLMGMDLSPPTRSTRPLLKDAEELGLGGQTQGVDLIQQDYALVGQLEKAQLAAPAGAGEGALLIAEKLGFDELLRDGGAVEGDEPLPAPGAGGKDLVGHHLLAGPRFSLDEEGGVGLGRQEDLPLELDHRGAAPHKAGIGVGPLGRVEILVFVHQLVELVVEPPVTPKPGLAVVDHVPYVGPFFIHQGGADKDGDIAVRFAGHGIHVGDKGDVEVTDVQDDGGLDPAEQLRHGHPLYVRGGLSEFGGVFLVDKDDAPLAVHHQLFAVVLQFGPVQGLLLHSRARRKPVLAIHARSPFRQCGK